MACVFCHRPINAQQDYRRVEGWERRRDAGGTNALRLREAITDGDGREQWACRWCIDKEARGLRAEQPSLGI